MKILFICSSNTCRSPYAEYIFSSLVDKSDVLKKNIECVSSSAVFNKSKEMHPRTRQILLEEGFSPEELDKFVPDYIWSSRKKYDETDIIIGMGLLQKILLPFKYRKKYMTLSQAAVGKDIHIADPWYNKSMDFYRNVMKMIRTLLTVYAEKLENEFTEKENKN